MSTLIAFTPNNNSLPPFSQPVTLDNVSYSLTAFWNLAGQRWFCSLVDQSGMPIWTGALVGSSLTFDILLAPGVFQASTLLYREDTGNFEITP